MGRAVMWWREHRLKLGGVAAAVVIAAYGWVLLDIQTDNTRQDTVDQGHVSDLAEVVVRLEEERQVSCAYSNELRGDLREFVTAFATNPEVVEQAAIEFADRPCPTIPTPTTTPEKS